MADNLKYYVFYDGDCGFCNFWVQWILQKDEKDQFMFASLQSEFGQRFLKERGLENKDFKTLYVWKPESYYLVKSEAVMKIAEILGGFYGFLSRMNILPRFFSNRIYDLIAENRNKITSRTCMLPTEAQKKKFVA